MHAAARMLGVLALSLGARFGWATGQEPDLLVYRGDTLLLQSNPLEGWLNTLPRRPAALAGMCSTACWRGYIATWALENSQLYLLRIDPCYQAATAPIQLTDWFALDATGRVAATWVSGQLNAVLGELLHYEHIGYESVYERDWLLTFRAGRLVGQQIFDNASYRKPSPTAESLVKQTLRVIDWDRVPRQAAEVRKRVFITLRPDSTGRHCQISLLKRCGPPYDSLALAAARRAASISWVAYYRFGRWQPEWWTIIITFDETNRRRYRAVRSAGRH
jgi:hypothetical protein